MYPVCLTGGIGAGKSTVSALLAERGAIVIDADAIARLVVEPGRPALAEIGESFGSGVIREDGTLDRGGLAAIVFNDKAKLERLNAITHPRIRDEVRRRLDEVAVGAVAVVDTPLLEAVPRREDGSLLTRATIVVSVDPETQIRHLQARGMDLDDAGARIANQPSNEERVAGADVVITNDGSLEDLKAKIDVLWEQLQAEALRSMRQRT